MILNGKKIATCTVVFHIIFLFCILGQVNSRFCREIQTIKNLMKTKRNMLALVS